MNRRQAMVVMGVGGGLVPAGVASAHQPAPPVIKVSVAIPELYDPDGKLVMAPTLRRAGYWFRFAVVVENVSPDPVHVWAEGNSEGHRTLSFEVTGPDGAKSVVRRLDQIWTKNVIRAERLAPGGLQVRVVEYDPAAGQPPQWEEFPFGEKDSAREVTLRAVFAQPQRKGSGKLAVWAGRVTSPAYKVVLKHA